MGPAIKALNDLAAAWSGSLVRATWQGGLAIAAAWVLVRCRPGFPPRVACWAWRLADLKLIVALLWATPLLLPLLPPSTPPGPVAEPIAVPRLSPRTAGGSEPMASAAGELAAPPAFPRPGPGCVVPMLWLSGVVVAAFLAGREWLAVARLRRSCLPVDGPDLRDAATDLARALGLRSVPELRTGPAVARPMLVGAFRPAILLPVAMLRDPRSTAGIRPVLAHELAHVRRRDLFWGGLAGLVRALFFFHPLVWLAHREALLAREADCDALALRASGVRPAEYGRILLEIATAGPERPSRWAATLGMAGPAGSLKRRLIAMKTTQQPSRRRLLSWAFVLLAIGAAGIIPWQLVPREVLAQDGPPAPPARQPAPDGDDERASATQREAVLKIAEARLELAEAQVRMAEAHDAAAAARREYRRKQRDRIDALVKQGSVEHRLLDEEEDRFRVARDEASAAEADIVVSRATRDAARATVREAEALRDIARAEMRGAPDAANDLKKARAHLREARADRARAERDAARAQIGRAQTDLRTSRAAVEYRTKQVGRLKELVQAKAIEPRLVDEHEEVLTEARMAERKAEAAVEIARARLKIAEARLKSPEADAEATDRGPDPSAPAPGRR